MVGGGLGVWDKTPLSMAVLEISCISGIRAGILIPDLLHNSHPALPEGCQYKSPKFWHQMKGINRIPGFCQHGCVKTEFGNADELIREWWVFLPHLPDKGLTAAM